MSWPWVLFDPDHKWHVTLRANQPPEKVWSSEGWVKASSGALWLCPAWENACLFNKFGKCLSVTITHCLRCKDHINSCFSERNLRVRFIPLKTTAYKTLVRRTLEYPCSGWHPYTLGIIEKLEMALPRAARFALSSHNNISNVSKGMLEQLGWVSMQMKQQAKGSGVCMLYNIHNGLVNLGNQCLRPNRRRPIRYVNCMAYKMPFSWSSYHQMSFFPRTIRQYMEWPFTLEAFNG